ncbi:uroporphyrinogen-III synthase [Alteromonas halophila]|uniref:uroporphyrinogen-III synthase n=1 Tax=Alteromonas halophila TaxID=516698 RepID=UPI0016781047|nr:uroporphyrinogen-III synthase [Alteromonas halophila]
MNASVLAFRQAGLDTLGVATTDIESLPEQEAALSEHLMRGTLPDLLIVTSVFAARALNRCIEHCPNRLRVSDLPVIAVGMATADCLTPVFKRVTMPQTQTSEGILALPALACANCQHIVIIKGEGGRDALRATLTARDKQVSTFCVYRRTMLERPVTTAGAQISEVSGIIATSEQLATQLLQHYPPHELRCLPWLTVSERVADSLRTQGVKDISVCAGASDSALIEWIKNNWE